MTDHTSQNAIDAAAEAARANEVSRQEQIDSALAKYAESEKKKWEEHLASTEAHRADVLKTIAGLATKKDIEEIKEFMHNVDLTFTVIRTSGKWGKTIILTLATIIVGVGVITGGLKAAIAGIAGWAISK